MVNQEVLSLLKSFYENLSDAYRAIVDTFLKYEGKCLIYGGLVRDYLANNKKFGDLDIICPNLFNETSSQNNIILDSEFIKALNKNNIELKKCERRSLYTFNHYKLRLHHKVSTNQYFSNSVVHLDIIDEFTGTNDFLCNSLFVEITRDGDSVNSKLGWRAQPGFQIDEAIEHCKNKKALCVNPDDYLLDCRSQSLLSKGYTVIFDNSKEEEKKRIKMKRCRD